MYTKKLKFNLKLFIFFTFKTPANLAEKGFTAHHIINIIPRSHHKVYVSYETLIT